MKEQDIRPQDVFHEYLRLSKIDAEKLFSNDARTVVPCPGCGSTAYESAFDKHGFGYVRCTGCRTLYQSPRPAPAIFSEFYSNSDSSTYWAKKFFPTVAEGRRSRIFRPRVERITQLCAERGLEPRFVADVGAGWGIFLEEWGKLHPGTRLLAIEPGAELAAKCRSVGLEVIEAFAEDVADETVAADVVACFEVLEHVYSPLAFVSVIARLVRKGGMAVVSTLTCDGFDLAVLGQRSNSIFPPHHINFLSIAGLKAVFERAGFSHVDVITPGVLDTDILKNYFSDHPSVAVEHDFLARLVRNPEAAAEFQELLRRHRLSSHAWVVAMK